MQTAVFCGVVPYGDSRHRVSCSCQQPASIDQNQFIDCPVRFQANRLKNFFPSEWYRDHQIVYVKADLLKVAGRVPGGGTI